MNLVFQFLAPYIQLCGLAAWGVAQNMEGVGLFTYINSPSITVNSATHFLTVWSVDQGVAVLLGIFALLLPLLFLLNIRACFYLSTRIGIVGLALWSAPGILALLGVTPGTHQFVPDVFRFGKGFSGSVESAAACLLILLVLGWSLVMLAGAYWPRDRFKNIYDHIWYPLGLVAALYFVIDSSLPFYRGDLDNSNERAVSVLNLYSDSTKNLELACVESAFVQSNAKNLCARVKNIGWEIKSTLEMGKVVRAKIQLTDWVKLLTEERQIGLEIDVINAWACGEKSLWNQCKKIPFDTLLSSKELDQYYFFPPNIYAQALLKYYASMEKSNRKIEDIERGHNIRYFAFLLVAFLAGGKVANATRALRSEDSIRPKSWLLAITRILIKFAKIVLANANRLWTSIYLCGRYRIALRRRKNRKRSTRKATAPPSGA
jgi:hypothetical protein